MFNQVTIVGNLTRNIELRYTQSGSAIGNTGIAATHKYSVNGEKREDTCFIDLTFFGKQAEIANQYLSKGSKLLVSGRLKFDQWTDNNGYNRSKHSIVVETMEMLGSSQQQGNGNQGYSQQGNQKQSNQNQGYGSQQKYGKQQNYNNQQSYGGYENQNFNQASQETYNQNINADKYDSDETIPF